MFWEEVSRANGGKVENSNRIKDGNGRLVLKEAELRRVWKEYYEDLYNINIQEKVGVHMCGFNGVQRGDYFGGEPIRRMEVEVGVGKLKNGKAAGKDEVTGEMIKGGGNGVVDRIWRLYNMAFDSGVVLEDWRFAVIIPLYKSKARTECSNYRDTRLLSVVEKIYARILVRKTTEGLIDDEQGGFRAGKGCVDQIFTPKQIGEKARE